MSFTTVFTESSRRGHRPVFPAHPTEGRAHGAARVVEKPSSPVVLRQGQEVDGTIFSGTRPRNRQAFAEP